MTAPGLCRPGCPCGADDPEPRCVGCCEPAYWSDDDERCPECRAKDEAADA